MQSVKFKIVGTRPLLMHADIFSDPLNALTKAHKQMTGKRKKTDEDHEVIAKSEWRGGLYWDEELGPYLPGVNIEAAMIEGGKLAKMGTTLKRSVEVLNDRCKLIYEGPRDIEGLWAKGFYDARSVKIQKNRVIRYRPVFYKWSTECELVFDPESIDRSSVVKALEDGGTFCGVGDYRPKFGRFAVEIAK